MYSIKIDSNHKASSNFKIRVRVEDFGGEKNYTDWSDYYFYSYSTQKRIVLDTIGDRLVSKSSMQNSTLIANHDNLKVQIATIGIMLSCITMVCLIFCLRSNN